MTEERKEYNHKAPQFYPETKIERHHEYIQFIERMFNRLDNDKNKLKIEKTDSGFIVEFPDDNGGNFPPKVVYEHDLIDEDKNGIIRMLWDIVEWIDIVGSRYDKERIGIKIEHGDKYDCKDKKCKICKEG